MTDRFAYLVPQFPGQTHNMFWEEIRALRERGLEPGIVTTRLAPVRLRSHAWTERAIAQTTALLPVGPLAAGRATLAAVRSPAARRALAHDWRHSSGLRDRCALLVSAVAGAHLGQVAKRRGWPHVHVHSCASAADIARYARLTGDLSYSLTLHGPLADYGPRQREKWAGAAFGIAITEVLRDELRSAVGEAMPADVPVVGMGVRPDAFQRPGPYLPWTPDSGPLRIFSCGRLNVAKGHDTLIRAVHLLTSRGFPVSLTIAGEDEHGGTGYRVVLAELVASLGLSAHVRLLGAVGEQDVRAELLDAHVFALASHAEPLGVVVMEAMAAGLPIVATDRGGIPQLVTQDVDGRLVPPGDPEALADALEWVVADPERAGRIAAAARVAAVRRAAEPSSAEVLAGLLAGRNDGSGVAGPRTEDTQTSPESGGRDPQRPLVVLCAANNWDDIRLADRPLAEALSATTQVLYVDPPLSPLTWRNNPRIRPALQGPRLRRVAPGIVRLTPVVAPFPFRGPMVHLTTRLVRRALRRALSAARTEPRAMVSTLLYIPVFDLAPQAVHAYWAQDSAAAGAAHWGQSVDRVVASERRLARSADLVLVASPAVVADWRAAGFHTEALPNGCDPTRFSATMAPAQVPGIDPTRIVAGFVGHLNERIDFGLLHAIVDAGIQVLMVGPVAGQVTESLDALVRRSGVFWVGPQPFEELPRWLGRMSVGLVPYRVDEFNLWSFPLKTLEYLAAGLPVVSTDLPASAWLASEDIVVAGNIAEFVAGVHSIAQLSPDPARLRRRQDLARKHSWDRRADLLIQLLELAT